MYKKISFVVPTYNERQTIETVIKKILEADVCKLDKEIIFVDDSSVDGTREFLQQINNPKIRIYYQSSNQGKGSCMRLGFGHASGDLIIVQDADLEYDPSHVHLIIKEFTDARADVVYGSRYLVTNPNANFWHSLPNKIFSSFASILIGQKITDCMTCYKAFNRKTLTQVLPQLVSDRFGFDPEITIKVSKLGYQIHEVPISYLPRNHKEGKHMNYKGQVESLLALIRFSFLQ